MWRGAAAPDAAPAWEARKPFGRKRRCKTAVGSAVAVAIVFISDSKTEKRKKTSQEIFFRGSTFR